MELKIRAFAFRVNGELHFGIVEVCNHGEARIFRATLLDEEIDIRPCRTSQFRWELVSGCNLPPEFVDAVGEGIEATGIAE